MAQRQSLSIQPSLRPLLYDYAVDATGFSIATPAARRAAAKSLHSTLVRSEAAVLAALFALAIVLSWFTGAFQSEFGGSSDEAAHYVTALMIRDYIAGGFPSAPLPFAENYYLHYPKVAFGHWPPVFHSMQAVWMLVFGESRTSMLILVSLLTAGVAFLLFKLIKKYFGTAYGVWAAVLYLLLTPIQLQNTMIMTEPALSLFGLLAVLYFARYLQEPSWAAALWFALWTTLTVLTKGDGLAFVVVVPLSLLLTLKMRYLQNLNLWVAFLIVAVLCVPFTYLTLRMAEQGWTGQFGWRYTSQALPVQARLLAATFGPVLLTLALLGAWRGIRRGAEAPMLACMAAYACGIVSFQALVPSGMEVRKLVIGFPAVLFLAAAGARHVGELLQRQARPALTAAIVLTIGSVAWAVSGFTLIERRTHGYKQVAQYILSDPALQNSVILVSANEPSTGEGMLIAEVASREARPGHYILRASKVISHSDWSGAQNYRMFYSTSGELLNALDRIPVDLVVVDDPPLPQSPPHHRLLLDAIRQNPDRWNLLFATDAGPTAGAHRVKVFRAAPRSSRPKLTVKLDLTESLGRSLRTPGT